ncbi:MAG: serine/threonine protein kinase, partial [Planctomycetota bacterium]|nr:serine/threonine protein kinase [Planctomycetota bacterium]
MENGPDDNAPAIITSRDASRRGAVLESSYRMIRLLGRGTMSSVYLAEQLSMARPVALKILSPALAGDPEFVKRFLKEARASARLNHPNIVGAIDFGEIDSRYFLVMEFVDGDTLSALIRREAPLDEMRVVAIGRQIIRALEHAARHHVVHRDVKPANIMISRDGRVKLADFGLALVADAPGVREATCRAVGTPFYMAPELIRGEKGDWRADQCSLGESLYEAATGLKPFVGKNVSDVLDRRLREAPLPAYRVNPRVSRAFAGVLAKMMALSPADRYQSFSDLEKDFDSVAAGRKPGGAKSAGMFVRKGRAVAPAGSPPLAGAVERARPKRRVGLFFQAGAALIGLLLIFVVAHWAEVRGPRPFGVLPGPDSDIESLSFSTSRAMRTAWDNASRLMLRAERYPSPEALASARKALCDIVDNGFFRGSVYAALAADGLTRLDALEA